MLFSPSADPPGNPAAPTASWIAVGVGFLSFAVYLLTLAPSVVGGDSGELITAAVTLGVPHPPGYPLYCLLAHLFTWLPVGTMAYRVNLFSAAAGALTTGLLTYAAVIAGAFVTNSSKPIFLAVTGWTVGILWSCSQNFWSQAITAEVYTLHTCFAAAYFICLIFWSRHSETKWLYRSALILGFSMAHHHLTLLFLPVLFFQWIFTQKNQPVISRLTFGAKTLGLFCLPLLAYLYLPIRAWMTPAYDWAKAVDFQSFADHVLRRQYDGLKLDKNLSTFTDPDRFLNFTLFSSYIQHLTFEYTWAWLAFLASIFPLLKRPKLALPLFFIWFMGSFFIWLNIRKGEYSHYLFNVFLLGGEMSLILLMGIGLIWTLNTIGKTRWGTLAMAAGLAMIPIGAVSAHWQKTSRQGDYIVRDIYAYTLNSLPKDAIYFSYGDTNTSTLLYLKLVEKLRPDVLVLDYNGGQAFRETPSNWAPNNDAKKALLNLQSMVNFIRQVKDPVYIAYGHPLIPALIPSIVPYGPMAHYVPDQSAVKNYVSNFPWEGLRMRGLETPALFSDYWNWVAVGDSILGRIFEKYGAAGIQVIDNFAKILLLTPKAWMREGGLSLLYISQGRVEEALHEQYRIVLAAPKEPAVYYNLGLLCAAAGSAENAAILWRHAKRLNPHWSTAEDGLKWIDLLRNP